ncbi:MAG: hypothetical protein AB4368_27495 [Xenococcaceae cyanobacterium]
MSTKNQILMGLILATMSKVMMITPANASPDMTPPSSPPETDNFVPDDFNFSSNSIVGGIAIPPEMSLPTGAADGSSVSGEGTMTLADIADYYAKNIDRSLNDLATEDVAQKPRRIVRRRSAVCPNPKISRSSEKLDDLLNQSEQFIEQVNQIKPENRIW